MLLASIAKTSLPCWSPVVDMSRTPQHNATECHMSFKLRRMAHIIQRAPDNAMHALTQRPLGDGVHLTETASGQPPQQGTPTPAGRVSACSCRGRRRGHRALHRGWKPFWSLPMVGTSAPLAPTYVVDAVQPLLLRCVACLADVGEPGLDVVDACNASKNKKNAINMHFRRSARISWIGAGPPLPSARR